MSAGVYHWSGDGGVGPTVMVEGTGPRILSGPEQQQFESVQRRAVNGNDNGNDTQDTEPRI